MGASTSRARSQWSRRQLGDILIPVGDVRKLRDAGEGSKKVRLIIISNKKKKVRLIIISNRQ